MTQTVKVLESFYTILGVIVALIESDYGKPSMDTLFCDSHNLSWKIINDAVFLDAKVVARLLIKRARSSANWKGSDTKKDQKQ